MSQTMHGLVLGKTLLAAVENLCVKHLISLQYLEMERQASLTALDRFLAKLGYLGVING